MLTQDKVRIHLHLTIQVAEENVHKLYKLYLLDNSKNAAENIYSIRLRPPLNFIDSSDFLPLTITGLDIPGGHPEPLKNHIECLVFSHFSLIFWCGWVEVG